MTSSVPPPALSDRGPYADSRGSSKANNADQDQQQHGEAMNRNAAGMKTAVISM
ncbi:MAG: hypothetical protein OXI34_15405 [Chloroflexota bacterium]|nr:hypothetical protein [Chloroflexota bacterium]MDE2947273.1 hypothetical protein [Chloroflexota bacterium]